MCVWRQVAACHLAHRLAADDGGCDALGDAGICEAVCATLAVFWNEPDVQVAGLRALATLAGELGGRGGGGGVVPSGRGGGEREGDAVAGWELV